MVLGVDFCKLCEDENTKTNLKHINYKCNKCNIETKIPLEIAKHFKNIYELVGNKNLPHFDCTECDGELIPTNPMEF